MDYGGKKRIFFYVMPLSQQPFVIICKGGAYLANVFRRQVLEDTTSWSSVLCECNNTNATQGSTGGFSASHGKNGLQHSEGVMDTLRAKTQKSLDW